ncbi:MAG TPA: J domain-containing protein [Acidimicrobiales bacterium]|nr:J domain-containing protein [Acidimicrobiales bacterium]
MGKRRAMKNARRDARTIISSDAGSATPWWYDEKTFAPKSSRDQRNSSEFFSEFSTESLYSDGPATSPAATALTDPYEVLGLFPGATLDQVKKAHRKLAKQYHPDRFMSAPDAERHRAELKMVQVNGAYAELQSRVMPRGG